MASWTTEAEHAWLGLRFPEWNARHLPKNKGFMKKTTVEFLELFPKHKASLNMEAVSTTFVVALHSNN